jgi:rSAM/selenodomain-associated transferase 1
VATIVIFARAPVAGQVKTRLAKAIGEDKALALYEAFLDDVCQLTAGLGARRVLAVAGDIDHPSLVHLGKSQRLELVPQGEGDLGARLERAVTRELGRGPVVIIGSDAPTLPRAELHRALGALVDHDFVVGPARDGGYWLIGARVTPPADLFSDIAWSTPEVLPRTLERLGDRSYVLLAEHDDVDTGEDLARLQAELAQLDHAVAPATRRALAAVPGGVLRSPGE